MKHIDCCHIKQSKSKHKRKTAKQNLLTPSFPKIFKNIMSEPFAKLSNHLKDYGALNHSRKIQ